MTKKNDTFSYPLEFTKNFFKFSVIPALVVAAITAAAPVLAPIGICFGISYFIAGAMMAKVKTDSNQRAAEFFLRRQEEKSQIHAYSTTSDGNIQYSHIEGLIRRRDSESSRHLGI